jgi:23S rRNA (uracil1939-C5)-methyltransferase
VWWHPATGAPRALAGASSPWPATVFEQVHPAMGAVVRQAALAALGAPEGTAEVAWDLYAGIGETTDALAEGGYRAESVEIDPRAVTLARTRGVAGPRREVGDVAVMVGRLSPPGVVVVNPPRVGLHERVAAALARTAARRLAYISCNPATLARDLARLADRFRVVGVTAFDQFPQTAHVESLAILEPR